MGLSADQWRFIAARLVANSDKEAAESVGMSVGNMYNWKLDPEFKAEYTAAFTDGVHVAMELSRQNLGKAANALAEGLLATTVVSIKPLGTTSKRPSEEKLSLGSDPLSHDVSSPEESPLGYVKIEVPDHRARQRSAELIFKAHGLLVEKVRVGGEPGKPLEVKHSGIPPGYILITPEQMTIPQIEELLSARARAASGDNT
jgi:hypothetical protein